MGGGPTLAQRLAERPQQCVPHRRIVRLDPNIGRMAPPEITSVGDQGGEIVGSVGEERELVDDRAVLLVRVLGESVLVPGASTKR